MVSGSKGVNIFLHFNTIKTSMQSENLSCIPNQRHIQSFAELKCTESGYCSLVAKKRIRRRGTFLGLYTGSYVPFDSGSTYSVATGGGMSISPFPGQESNIPTTLRQLHLLANMNEPSAGQTANCFLRPVDVPGSRVQNGDPAKSYRGMGMFTCCEIQKGEELKWNYGKGYQPHRERQNYEAGRACETDIGSNPRLPAKFVISKSCVPVTAPYTKDPKKEQADENAKYTPSKHAGRAERATRRN